MSLERGGLLLLGGLAGLVLAGVWLRWLDHRLAVLPGWRTGVRRLVGVAVIGFPMLFVVSMLWIHELDPAPIRPVLWVSLTWTAFVFYLTLGVLVLTVLSAVLCAPLRLTRRGPDGLRRLLHRIGAPLSVLVALAITGYGLVVAADPRLVDYTVTSAELPVGWDSARVVLVTDLHVGPIRTASYTREVVDLVNAQRPDLVLLGGDLIDGRERWVGPYLDPLADLDATLGVYAVTGNHEFLSGDADAYVQRWRSLGITALRNSHVALERGGNTIELAGVDDQDGAGKDAPDPGAALDGVAGDAFTLFLAHEPRQVAPGLGVDLQLSGHTHGGQLWPFGYLVGLQQPTLDGLESVQGVPVLTSRGVGTWGPPVRVGARPEIDVVTLRRPAT